MTVATTSHVTADTDQLDSRSLVQLRDNTHEEITEAEYGVKLNRLSHETQLGIEQTYNGHFMEETER